ncbi:MAG TPA: hypothetical protein VJG90_03110 [Candidatus Nanoarchaeia archaeon]|nr:hypothetical protein [Candidatus Nanoarchaeia archaeon]
MNKKGQFTKKRAAGIVLLFGGFYLIIIDQPIVGLVFAAVGFALLIPD